MAVSITKIHEVAIISIPQCWLGVVLEIPHGRVEITVRVIRSSSSRSASWSSLSFIVGFEITASHEQVDHVLTGHKLAAGAGEGMNSDTKKRR
jgi:hypothetical protein